jgi:hypothetical protein
MDDSLEEGFQRKAEKDKFNLQTTMMVKRCSCVGERIE